MRRAVTGAYSAFAIRWTKSLSRLTMDEGRFPFQEVDPSIRHIQNPSATQAPRTCRSHDLATDHKFNPQGFSFVFLAAISDTYSRTPIKSNKILVSFKNKLITRFFFTLYSLRRHFACIRLSVGGSVPILASKLLRGMPFCCAWNSYLSTKTCGGIAALDVPGDP